MIKSLTAGLCLVAFTGTLAFAQPSQSQGGGNAGTNGTSDSTMQNGMRPGGTGTTGTGSATSGSMAKPNDAMHNNGMKKNSGTGAAGGSMSK